MKEFSATDAAIEGFALARRQPMVILAWSLAQFLASLALGAIMVLAIGPDMQKIGDPATVTALSDAATRGALTGSLLRILGVTAPIALIWAAVQSCAVYRAVLRPEDKGLAYLKAGADEFRILVLLLIYAALGVAALVVVTFAVSLIAAVVMSVVAAQDKQSIAVLTVAIGFLVALLAVSWALVRLSLAGPMTFVERRIQLRGAWTLSRGHFWALSGVYLISTILAWVVTVTGSCAGLLIGFVVTHQSPVALYQMVAHPDFSSLAAYFNSGRLMVIVVQGLFMGLFTAIWYAAPAAAYRMLAGSGAVAQRPVAATGADEPPAPKGPWG